MAKLLAMDVLYQLDGPFFVLMNSIIPFVQIWVRVATCARAGLFLVVRLLFLS